MKRKFLIILLAIISVVACALGLTACNVGNGGDNSGGGSSNSGGNSGGSTVSLSGTYYLYEDGKLDKSQYITFNGSKWSDDDSVNGTFTLNGTTIVFYADVFGNNEEMYSGTLTDGKLTVSIFGSTVVYYKEGSEPSESIGGNENPPTPPVKNEYSVTYNLNYIGASNVTKDTEDKLATYIPTRSGFEFNGWYLDSGLMQYFDTSELVTADGLVLYASWVEEATEAGQLSAPVISVSDNVFSWKAIVGATGYRVVVSQSGSTTNIVDETVKITNWTFPTSLDAGVYSVKIRAIGDGITTVNSVYSSRTFSLRVLNTVTGITLDKATSLLTWNEVSNAEEYNIYVGNQLVSTQTETLFDMSNFDAGSLTVKITATKENWLTSQGSATLSKMRLKTPEVIITIEPTTKSYVLKWDSVRYADTYILKYGEKEIEIKETTYTLASNSVVWNGQNTTSFVINAFDSKADYLISAGAKEITLNKIYTLNVEKNIEEAGSTFVEGNVWQPVTVSFDLNGASGSVASQTVTTTQGLNYPTLPTRSGYIFRGWFTEKSCENIFDFTATIKNNITLYAGWQSYSGTFVELNSGSSSYSSTTSYKYYYFRALSNSQIRIGYSQTSSSPTSYLRIYDVTKGEEWLEETSFKNTTPSTTSFYPVAGHVYYLRTHSSSSTTLNISFSTYPSTTFLPSDGGKAIADYVLETNSNSSLNYAVYNNNYIITATTTDDRYIFSGWYNGETLLTKELTYSFDLLSNDVHYTAKWIYYSVTTQKNIEDAGTITSYNDTPFKEGNSITLTARTNSGYTWLGWYDGDLLITDELSYSFNMSAKNIVYTAKWTYYTITTNANDSLAGTYTIKSETKTTLGSSVKLTATTNDGSTWLGWYNGDELLTDALSYTFNMPAQNVIYTAKWAKYKLTIDSTDGGTVYSYYGRTQAKVSFNLNGGTGTINTKTITSSTGLTYPDIPERDGYVFRGWFTDKDCTEVFDFSSAVTEDIELFAGWQTMNKTTSSYSNYYLLDVTSNYNSSSKAFSPDNSVTVSNTYCYTYFAALTSGDYVIYYKNNYSSTNYGIRTYIYNVTTKTDILASTNVTNTSYYSRTITANAGDVICIRTQRSSTYYTGTFSMYITGGAKPTSGGKFNFNTAVQHGVNVTSGKSITLSATASTGYSFAGWYNGDELLESNTSYTFNMPNAQLAITAKFNINQYTITFNSNGGTEIDTMTVDYGAELDLSIKPTLENKSFAGWYTNESLSNKFTLTSMPAYNLTLYAKWIDYSITSIKYNTVKGVKEDTELTPDIFGAYAVDTDGEKLDVTLEYTGNYKAGELINVTFKAANKLATKETTLTGIKVYGTPIIDIERTAISTVDSIIPSTFSANAYDSFDSSLVVTIKVLSGIQNGGNIMNIMFTATDIVGNSFSVEKEIRVYDINDIAVTYENYTAIKYLLKGQEFGVIAIDSFGEDCTVNIYPQNGSWDEYIIGKVVSITIKASDAAGNSIENHIENVKIYDTPIVVLTNEANGYIMTEADNISSLLKVCDSFGNELSANITTTDNIVSGNLVNVEVTAEDCVGNICQRIYKFYVCPIENKYFVELYANNDYYDSLVFTSATEYSLPILEKLGYDFVGWFTLDCTAMVADQYGVACGNLNEHNQFCAVFVLEGYKAIFNSTDLIAMESSGNYELICDINLKNVSWSPIVNFTGIFKGNNNTISNFKITTRKSNDLGFFATNKGTIVDLTLSNVTITSPSSTTYLGGLVGTNEGGLVDNCHILNVNISCGASDNYLGGLVGRNRGEINNCTASGSISNSSTTQYHNDYVGMLVGANTASGSINNCSTSGTITTTSYGYSSIGGVAGNNSGSMDQTFSTVNIVRNTSSGYPAGKYYIGGLIGSNSGTINNCYTLGKVDIYQYYTGTGSGEGYIGGFVGLNTGTIYYCYETGDVSYHIQSASTVIIENWVGGFVGYNNKGKIYNSFATGNVSSANVSGWTNDNYAGGFVGLNEGTINSCYRSSSQTLYRKQGNTVSSMSNSLGTSVALSTIKTYDFIINTLQWDEGIWLSVQDNFPMFQ